MEGQSAKRRRVYSLEPNNVEQAVFTTDYVNYLVPSLMKIKKCSFSGHNKQCNFQNIVKHEVDMAMVFSAQGFAWSGALKVKLLRSNDVNVYSSSTTFAENEASEKGSMVLLDLMSSNPSSKSQEGKILVKMSKYNDMPEKKKGLEGEDNEDEVMNNQFRCLRKLIPGGEKMCNEQMVMELESYISCLQMQVNILQCLTETS
ncbi:hypothetical protein TanjilG_21380 [Lupinus angustifolius]|uniref:IBH1-like N-terminal domain-containing protein n=1 Tax=Lupinus angustifolius TaxID=3871 RepID=A0A4P1RND1_LUPAN|nr:PREDICTED: uncharacterized protein At4g30180-like [Lupinus angustifolius]OIW14240.1 hypothetical protein TanjilG_21380 [Lupinus angustifolius]